MRWVEVPFSNWSAEDSSNSSSEGARTALPLSREVERLQLILLTRSPIALTLSAVSLSMIVVFFSAPVAQRYKIRSLNHSNSNSPIELRPQPLQILTQLKALNYLQKSLTVTALHQLPPPPLHPQSSSSKLEQSLRHAEQAESTQPVESISKAEMMNT